MVLPASHRVSRVPWYSGHSPKELNTFRLQGFHLLWPIIPNHSTRCLVCHSSAMPYHCPENASNPTCTTCKDLTYTWFRLIPFRSPLLWESQLLSLPSGTEMFHFPEFALTTYIFSCQCQGIPLGGFPHSGIPGSKSAGDSPRLIAANHALHRFLMPRHPPYTLHSLDLTCF